jgi:biotin carboxyl carrier protein
MKYEVVVGGARRIVDFAPSLGEPARMSAVIDGHNVEFSAATISPGIYSILFGQRSFEINVEKTSQGMLVRVAGREFQVTVIDPRSWRATRRGSVELEGRQEIAASMPGKIVRVLVVPGQKVEPGQGLLVIEAMKMQNEIRSPKSGTIESTRAKEGQTVSAGEILVVVT